MPDFKKILLSFTNCLSSLLLWWKRPSANANERSPSSSSWYSTSSRTSHSSRSSHSPKPSTSRKPSTRSDGNNDTNKDDATNNAANDDTTDDMSTRRKRAATSTRASSHRSGYEVATLPKDEMVAFEMACLKVHNKYRAQHGCPPLKLKHELNVLASDWAQTLAKRNKMDHRPNNDDYGENIYYSEGMDVNAEAAVKMWYDEIQMYNFKAAKFHHSTGHFTQLIWRETTELGVGVATKGNKVWVVSNYAPPGNWEGEFRENVPPKKT